MVTLGLEDLVKDRRLSRLFSSGHNNCALQLWIMETGPAHPDGPRIIHGRLLPYGHGDETWRASDRDRTAKVGDRTIHLHQLSLYFNASKAESLLRALAEGETLRSISTRLGLALPTRLQTTVGSARLKHGVACRPVALLPNKDAPEVHGLRSPHGGACAFSAALMQLGKESLFCVNGKTSMELASFLIHELNQATGLDFGGRDANRLGEIELLVFPTLDDAERVLLSFERTKGKGAWFVTFEPSQLLRHQTFQATLSVFNNGSVLHSSFERLNACNGASLRFTFDISDYVQSIADAVKVEIHAMDASSGGWEICCLWAVAFLREMSMGIHPVGAKAASIRLDWLERATQASAAPRVEAVQTIGPSTDPNVSVDGRKHEPWISENRQLHSLLSHIHPMPSEARFFPRLSDSRSLSRLEFAEWLKKVLLKHSHHQLIIFDPYFRVPGTALIAASASSTSQYIVFTTVPERRPSERVGQAAEGGDSPLGETGERDDDDGDVVDGVESLLAACQRLKEVLLDKRFRIYGLPAKSLHDRYILIADENGLPVKGFHLSNSLQRAMEQHPLLVTPIPQDALNAVSSYAQELLQRTMREEAPGTPIDAPRATLLFDSQLVQGGNTAESADVDLLDSPAAGVVLADSMGIESLRALGGPQLREELERLHLLQAGALAVGDGLSVERGLGPLTETFEALAPRWEVLTRILATTPEDRVRETIVAARDVALDAFLEIYLGHACECTTRIAVGNRTAHLVPDYFNRPLPQLLNSGIRVADCLYPVKYPLLTWGEFYAVRFLWIRAPQRLIAFVQRQVTAAKSIPTASQAVRFAVLSQAISEMALPVYIGRADEQRELLLQSSNPLIKWLGACALEQALADAGGIEQALAEVDGQSPKDRFRIWGWLLRRAAERGVSGLRDGVAAMQRKISAPFAPWQTAEFMDAMRGHMKGLGWAEPWLFNDVVVPLIESGHLSVDTTCDIWSRELDRLWRDTIEGAPMLFRISNEGRVTQIAARLFACSSVPLQQGAMERAEKMLSQARRNILRPLASTTNWQKWNASLELSMWLLAFTKWTLRDLALDCPVRPSMEQLSKSCRELALRRSLAEWRSDLPGGPVELVQFAEAAGDI